MEFRKWLEKNHDKETELLVGFFKVDSGKQNMTWSQSVDQALCFGWIDSIRHTVDHESYCIRFTPRRSGSKWSAVNIRKIEKLTEKGLMHQAGIISFRNRKKEDPDNDSYNNMQLALPFEYEKNFRGSRKAWEFFEVQPPFYRKNIIRWILDAKQETTRLRRLSKAIEESKAGRKLF